MKHTQLLSCVLFATAATHCMENNPWKAIDCAVIEKSLETDCHNYFKNRLHAYTKSDFTIADLEHINSVGTHITGKSNLLCTQSVYEIKDESNNSFLHWAIRKKDIAVVRWFLDHKVWMYNANRDNKSPIDLCIDHLSVNNINDAGVIIVDQKSHDLLDTLLTGYAQASLNLNRRKQFISKLITLELEHKKHGNSFVILDKWLAAFVQKTPKQFPDIFLSDLYQTVTDEEQNNYTHILVQKGLADQLYQFIKNGYVSFNANKDGHNPMDIALTLHKAQDFAALQDSVTQDAAFTTPQRCCFFMLYNYVKKEQAKAAGKEISNSIIPCCKHHTI